MKKRLIIITLISAIIILGGCGATKVGKTPTLQEPTEQPLIVEREDGGKEITITDGETYDSITSIIPDAKITQIAIPDESINNLLVNVYVSWDEARELSTAFPNYSEKVKGIIDQCQSVFLADQYTEVYLNYCPQSTYAELPMLTPFSICLVPEGDKYVVDKKSIDESVARLTEQFVNWNPDTNEKPSDIYYIIYSSLSNSGLYDDNLE